MTQWGVDTLFNPAKRHMDEEKRRLQSTRSEVGDNSGGKRIDLESGKVVIAKADDESADSTEASGTTSRRSKREGKAADASEGRSEAKALTPAQERALKRRGKLPESS